jgi:hypothetical protein
MVSAPLAAKGKGYNVFRHDEPTVGCVVPSRGLETVGDLRAAAEKRLRRFGGAIQISRLKKALGDGPLLCELDDDDFLEDVLVPGDVLTAVIVLPGAPLAQPPTLSGAAPSAAVLSGVETAGAHRETQIRKAAVATAAAEIEAAIPDVNRHRLASFGQKSQQPGWTGMGAAGQLLKDSKIAKRCVVCARPGSGRPLGSSTTHYCSAVTCGVRVALCQEGGGHHDRHCLSIHKSECEATAAGVEPRAVKKRRSSEPAS